MPRRLHSERIKLWLEYHAEMDRPRVPPKYERTVVCTEQNCRAHLETEAMESEDARRGMPGVSDSEEGERPYQSESEGQEPDANGVCDGYVSEEPNHNADPEIQQLLRKVRALVTKHDPLSKDTTDATLRRFLLARSKDVKKAADMFVSHQRWRRSYVPLGHIPPEAVQHELQSGKLFLQGHDKKGRPIIYARADKHIPHDIEVFKRFVVCVLDAAVASMPPGQEKFCAMVNLEGLGYKNVDVRGYISAFEFLQAYYPERLGKLYLLRAPYLFLAGWKVISTFIDKATKRKIVFVNNKTLTRTLLADIDEDQLPDVVGGTLPLVPLQDALIPNGSSKHSI